MRANVGGRRDDKSATPCQHGSIGKTKADDAFPWVHREKQGGRRAWHQIGRDRPPAKPMPPSRLALVKKFIFRYYAAITLRGVRQSSIRLVPSRARESGNQLLQALASNSCCHAFGNRGVRSNQ